MTGWTAVVIAATLLELGTVWHGWNTLAVSPDGRFFHYRGKTILLVGDSAAQFAMQNRNFDYRNWVDRCAERAMTAVHIHAFAAPHQKEDRSVIDPRWGYVYPGLTPWTRREGGPAALDQLPRWDLLQFDEGSDPATDYWPRLRDLAAHTHARGLVLGVTVFFGLPDAPSREEDWAWHPFNVRNGGHLTDPSALAVIHSPGTEVVAESWAGSWPPAKKTQWLWERFADKLLRELEPYDNVLFVFSNMPLPPAGNCGEHFARFFRDRGALYADWEARRERVDAVVVEPPEAVDRNSLAVEILSAEPVRPVLLLGSAPLAPESVRRSMWTFTVGGGHYLLRSAVDEADPLSGVMGFDRAIGPRHIPWLNYSRLTWLNKFLHQHIRDLSGFRPFNEIILAPDDAYCLALPGREYIVYLHSGGEVKIYLTRDAGRFFQPVWYDTQAGTFIGDKMIAGGMVYRTRPPFREHDDWVLHLWRGGVYGF